MAAERMEAWRVLELARVLSVVMPGPQMGEARVEDLADFLEDLIRDRIDSRGPRLP